MNQKFSIVKNWSSFFLRRKIKKTYTKPYPESYAIYLDFLVWNGYFCAYTCFSWMLQISFFPSCTWIKTCICFGSSSMLEINLKKRVIKLSYSTYNNVTEFYVQSSICYQLKLAKNGLLWIFSMPVRLHRLPTLFETKIEFELVVLCLAFICNQCEFYTYIHTYVCGVRALWGFVFGIYWNGNDSHNK